MTRLKHPKLRRHWRRFLLFGALGTLSLAVILAGAGWWLVGDLPPVANAALHQARPTTQILDRNGKLLYEVLDPEAGKQLDLTLANFPDSCVHATLATEDERFFLHPGVDPIAIARALWQNVQGGVVFSGGSTLTQQLARGLLMTPAERYEQSLRRKLREAWLAWQLERTYTKDQLLALYLNQTYYGNFAFGLEAAAQIFFAKPVRQLSTAECALLAGLVQYPTGYNPLADPETAKNRQLTVLRLMQEAGYLDAAESAEVAKEPLRYRSRLFGIEAPHFVMYVQDLLAAQLGVDRLRDGGLRVVTTLDLDLQRQAEAAVRRRLDQLTCRAASACDDPAARDRRVENAAAVILDSQRGDILAMVGSPDYFDPRISGNVNAALSLRQPGSAIKPFTYAAALDPAWSRRSGQPPLTPATVLPDLPTTFVVSNVDGITAAYRPQNYDRMYHGPVSVRTALANSYNIPAVAVLERIGVESLRDLATQAGIDTFSGRYGLALTLGGGDVRLLELTAAYGLFDDGAPLHTQALLQVEPQDPGGDGKLPALDTSLPPARQTLTPETAYLITDILADPVARAPAFGANSVLNLPFAAAVKTGTTTDWRDNWTVGYSTARLVGVWVGNADNSPMVGVSGVDGAGPIWHDLMLLAHPVYPPAFSQPDGLTEVEICAPSGLLPTAECPRRRRELFVAGTQPTAADDQFQRIAIDLATGRAATADTPASRRRESIYWVLPPAYHDWMVSQGIALAPAGVLAESAAQNSSLDSPVTRHPSPVTGQSETPPLILTSPAPFTAFQLHPGVAAANQQLTVAGFVGDGQTWAQLRLMVDGQVVAEARDAARLRVQWPLQIGAHNFWIEGEEAAAGATLRSLPATIEVVAFTVAPTPFVRVD